MSFLGEVCLLGAGDYGLQGIDYPAAISRAHGNVPYGVNYVSGFNLGESMEVLG